jgi:hypothetical protein
MDVQTGDHSPRNIVRHWMMDEIEYWQVSALVLCLAVFSALVTFNMRRSDIDLIMAEQSQIWLGKHQVSEFNTRIAMPICLRIYHRLLGRVPTAKTVCAFHVLATIAFFPVILVSLKSAGMSLPSLCVVLPIAAYFYIATNLSTYSQFFTAQPDYTASFLLISLAMKKRFIPFVLVTILSTLNRSTAFTSAIVWFFVKGGASVPQRPGARWVTTAVQAGTLFVISYAVTYFVSLRLESHGVPFIWGFTFLWSEPYKICSSAGLPAWCLIFLPALYYIVVHARQASCGLQRRLLWCFGLLFLVAAIFGVPWENRIWLPALACLVFAFGLDLDRIVTAQQHGSKTDHIVHEA